MRSDAQFALGDPRQTMVSLARAIGRGEPEAAARCFGEDACLITPGATTRGQQGIRRILGQLFTAESRIEVRASSLESAHGMAVGSERWQVRSPGPGAALARELEATVVMREADGIWALVLATLCTR
jgi:hypothetical protein